MNALQYVVKNARTSAVTLLLDFSSTACGLFRSRLDPDNLARSRYWLDVFGLSANVTGLPKLLAVEIDIDSAMYVGAPYLDDLDGIRPSDLAVVKYYPIESAAGEYRKLTDNCGVLLLWTRK